MHGEIVMMKSMTGYGRAEKMLGDLSLAAEIRSVNHRHCDIQIRLPKSLMHLEPSLKKRLQTAFSRGRIELTVMLNGAEGAGRRLELDLDLAKEYYKVLRDLQASLGLAGDIDLGLLSSFRDVVTVSERDLGGKDVGAALEVVVDSAVARLERMRLQEGRALASSLRKCLQVIEKTLFRIQRKAPLVVKAYHGKMRKRIAELTTGIHIDPARLAQEAALYASRCDITEEISRMKSHLTQFRKMFEGPPAGPRHSPEAEASSGGVGRTMDFLIQEMNREVNTVGSKADDAAISADVVAIKGELEKLREQVQNVE